MARRPAVAQITLACCLSVFTGCSGGGTTPTPTPAPTPTPTGPTSGAEFLYTFGFIGDVQVATLNTTTGTISSLTDAAPNLIPSLEASRGNTFAAFLPGKYFYVAAFDQSAGSGAVFAFTITGVHGELTSILSSPYDIPIDFPTGIAIDGQGKYLYVSGGNIIRVFQIDKDTGILTNTGRVFSYGNAELAVQCGDSTGRYIYTLEYGDGIASIHILSIGFAGALTEVPGSPLLVYSAPSGSRMIPQLLVNPTGSYLYLLVRSTDSLTGTFTKASVYSFSIDAATGALTAVPSSPFNLTISNPIPFNGEITMSPNGEFLYIPEINQSSEEKSMSVYAMDPAQGTIGLAPASSITSTDEFDDANLIDPSGQFLISRSANATTWGYWSNTINGSTGSLSPVTGSPFDVNNPISSASYGGSAIVRIP